MNEFSSTGGDRSRFSTTFLRVDHRPAADPRLNESLLQNCRSRRRSSPTFLLVDHRPTAADPPRMKLRRLPRRERLTPLLVGGGLGRGGRAAPTPPPSPLPQREGEEFVS